MKHGYEILETLKGENYIITFIYLVLTSTIFKLSNMEGNFKDTSTFTDKKTLGTISTRLTAIYKYICVIHTYVYIDENCVLIICDKNNIFY